MDFIKIDKEKWQRKKVFELYSKDVPCTYSMTINLDITGLKNKIEIKQLKFFPVILYGLSKFVNKYKEFRMDLNKDGELGYYDKINPIFTVFEEAQEQFYQVWTKYDDDFEVFYQNYLLDMKNYQQQEIKSSKLLLEKNVFNVSFIITVAVAYCLQCDKLMSIVSILLISLFSMFTYGLPFSSFNISISCQFISYLFFNSFDIALYTASFPANLAA